MNTQSTKKRPFYDSPSAHTPPLAQRIRSDFQICEESPVREVCEVLENVKVVGDDSDWETIEDCDNYSDKHLDSQ